jgi:hypothetical protein
MWMCALFGKECDGCCYVMGVLGNADDGEQLSAAWVVVFCVSCVCMVVSCWCVLRLVMW